MVDYAERADRYAHLVAAGKIPANLLVMLACKRHIADRKKKRFRWAWDADEINRVCSIIELFPHVKGRWAQRRENIVLNDWQVFAVASIFGWRCKKGLRRFTEAYLQIARKNGKSLLAAAIGLIMFAADNEAGAEVYSGATTEKQSFEIFSPARQILKRTPEFCEAFGIEVMTQSLAIIENNSKFQPVIGKPGDGSSPSCALIDEYHEHKTPDLYDTMLTGMGAREQPLLLVITTAGTDTSGPCYERFDYAKRVLTGAANDDRFFALVYGIDESDDWTNPEVLEKANPNLNVSVSKDFLITEQKKAAQNPARANIFRIKHLNEWVNAKQTWLNLIDWQKCCQDFDLNEVRHLPAVLAIDFAQRVDVCAAQLVFIDRSGPKIKYYAKPKFWLPSDAVLNDPSKAYEGWVNAGYLETTDGAELDYNVILDWIRDQFAEFNILEFVFDPWRTNFLVQQLLEDGIIAVEFRNTPKNLTEAMRETEAAIASGRLINEQNPVMSWMIGNAVKVQMRNELTTITKEKAHKKIDGVSALLMALGRAQYAQEPQKIRSIYESTEL